MIHTYSEHELSEDSRQNNTLRFAVLGPGSVTLDPGTDLPVSAIPMTCRGNPSSDNFCSEKDLLSYIVLPLTIFRK